MTVNSYSGVEVFVTIGGKLFKSEDLNMFQVDIIDKDEGDNEVDIHCYDSDFAISDSTLFRVGAVLSIKWGYSTTGIFSGERTGYVLMKSSTEYDKHGIISVIHATTKSATLAARRPQKNYGQTTLATIVKEVAKRNNLMLSLKGGTESLDGFSQGNWSDRQMLRVLADRFGYQVSYSSETITFAPRDFSATPALTLVFGQGEDSTIISAKMEVDVHSNLGAATSTIIKTVDPGSKLVSCHASGNPAQELNVYAGDGHDWVANAVQPLIDKATVVVTQSMPQSPTGGLPDNLPPDIQAILSSPDFAGINADLQASSINQREQKKHADLTVDSVGIPSALARMVVEVKGVSKRDSGLYYISEVHHAIKVKGTYECKFKLNRHGTNAGGGAKVKAPVNMQSSHDSSLKPISASVSATTGQLWH